MYLTVTFSTQQLRELVVGEVARAKILVHPKNISFKTYPDGTVEAVAHIEIPGTSGLTAHGACNGTASSATFQVEERLEAGTEGVSKKAAS